MVDGRGSGQGHAISPLDEEREPSLVCGDVGAHTAPADDRSARCHSRTGMDGLAQPASDGIDRVCSNGPAKQAPRCRSGDPLPEGGPSRSLTVGYRHKLEIAVAERDDPVRRAPRWMTTALDRGQPIARLEPGCLERQVTDRQDDVVDSEHSPLK